MAVSRERNFQKQGRDYAAAQTRWVEPSMVGKFSAMQTDAHRVASGRDGWAERLGEDLLISFKTEAFRDEVLAGLGEWGTASGWNPCRVFGKFLPKKNEERNSPVLIAGDSSLPLKTVVQESGVKFALDFEAGYSAGLFIDQRGNRSLVRQRKPKRLLNTFSYTCSFSVVGALAGSETTSVDLSKKSLDRGRENFALNGVDAEGNHRFYADDVMDFLPRLVRRSEKFDMIILDPPTFSRGNDGRRWNVEEGLENLLMQAMELTTPNAAVLLSTNCTKLNVQTLQAIVRFVLKTMRRGGNTHCEQQLEDFPRGHGASTLWVTLRG